MKSGARLFAGALFFGATVLLAGVGSATVQSLLSAGGQPAAAVQRPPANRPLKTGVAGDRGARAAAGLAAGLQRVALARRPEQAPAVAREEALRALEQELGGPVLATFGADGKTVRQLELKTPATRRDAARSAARTAAARAGAERFLGRNTRLLGLADAVAELRLERQESDELGLEHLRYQQVFDGVPLWAQELLVHVDADGEVYRVNGGYSPSPVGLDTNPAITGDAAIAAAEEHLGPVSPDRFGKAPSAELAIYTDKDGTHRLVYKVILAPQLGVGWTYFIDAGTGAFVHRITNVIQEAASGVDYFGVNRTFTVWPYSGSYVLSNPGGSGATGQTHVWSAGGGTLADGMAYFVTSANLVGGWDATAVSVAYHMERTLDYYASTHFRNGVDGNGTDAVSVVHYGTGSEAANAFWNGQFMAYGDGGNDPTIFAKPLGVGLDVVAHEFTHGVTQHTANLVYQDQSGALNESFSDFFAAMVDREDWTMGEDITGTYFPGFLRSLSDPNRTGDPAHMREYVATTQDNGGVHTNSGIPNRALYLLADGLTAEGLGTSVGRAKAEKIAYRALATYLTAQSQFRDARAAMLAAAEELYGATERAAVAAAWDAVGVTDAAGSGPSDSAPTDATPLTGTDLMVFLYPTDGSHDNPLDTVNDAYDLYVRSLTSGQTSSDLNTSRYLEYTRPAPVTTAAGTTLFYVSTDHNLYARELTAARDEAITTAGGVWSIAVAPDAAYFAFTPDDLSDNNIYVVDLSGGGTAVHPIVSYSDADVAANTVLYADSLAFDYTGRKIVFDALNCIAWEGSSCADGGGLKWWSVGILDVVTGELLWPLPGQSPLYDLGYPSFAANNNYVIALSAQDWTEYAATGTVASSVWAVDLKASRIQELDNQTNGSSDPGWAVWGAPSFRGDDAAVTVQRFTDTNGFAYQVPVNAAWQGDPGAAAAVTTGLAGNAAALPVMHRAAARQVSGAIQYSATALNFGTVVPNGTTARSLTLTNVGNRDLWVNGVSVSGAGFSHNATPMPLPQGRSATITVSFQAGDAVGQQGGALTIASDADNPSQRINLLVAVGSSGGGDTGGGGGGGGGGCFVESLVLP